MKKNILTIIIMAIVLINTVLTGVLIFVIVPTSNKTNQLVTKVASIVDLELEDSSAENAAPAVSDIMTFNIEDELTINLKNNGDGATHYALIKTVSISVNSKHKDYTALYPKMQDNVTQMKEIINDEISKYTVDDVQDNKETIKKNVLTRIQELFNSDFIINVSFGNLVLS